MKKQVIFNLIIGTFIGSTVFLTSCGGEDNKSEAASGKVEDKKQDPLNVDNLPKEEKMPITTIEFAELVHDFGRILTDTSVTHEFEFTNTGQHPLMIKDAKASCGCTIPVYPKDPIAPGKSEKILVKFNSKGKEGQVINKEVKIFGNLDPNPSVIVIKGKVDQKS